MQATEKLKSLATFLFMHYNDLPPELDYWGFEESKYKDEVWEKGDYHLVWLKKAEKAEKKIAPLMKTKLRADMEMIPCISCGEFKYLKVTASRICPACQNAKRQRKKYIRLSVKQGLSLEEILNKHRKMNREEVIEHYNSIMKEV